MFLQEISVREIMYRIMPNSLVIAGTYRDDSIIKIILFLYKEKRHTLED